jgi:hypothetical protein
MRPITVLLFLLSAMAAAATPPFPASALLSSTLGVPLSTEAKAQLAESLKANPGCDLLYLPLLRQRDVQAFKDYTSRAGTDSLILLYFLRERETYRPELDAVHWDTMSILKRLLWVNGSAPKPGICPSPITPTRVVFEGYTDEITEECYTATLTYRMGDTPQSVTFPFCGPLEREGGTQDFSGLMKQYKIPTLHRSMIEIKRTPLERDKLPKPTGK